MMRITAKEAKAHGLPVPPKKPKYRNVKTTIDGVTFHSKREAARYSELRLLEKAKKIIGLVLQPKFDFVINGKKVGSYTADFSYFESGTLAVIVEDAKGFKTQQYRLRKKLLEALHGIKVREV